MRAPGDLSRYVRVLHDLTCVREHSVRSYGVHPGQTIYTWKTGRFWMWRGASIDRECLWYRAHSVSSLSTMSSDEIANPPIIAHLLPPTYQCPFIVKRHWSKEIHRQRRLLSTDFRVPSLFRSSDIRRHKAEGTFYRVVHNNTITSTSNSRIFILSVPHLRKEAGDRYRHHLRAHKHMSHNAPCPWICHLPRREKTHRQIDGRTDRWSVAIWPRSTSAHVRNVAWINTYDARFHLCLCLCLRSRLESGSPALG